MWIFTAECYFSPHNDFKKAIVWLFLRLRLFSSSLALTIPRLQQFIFFLYRSNANTMNETFMKKKPVLPLLVSMALPNVISMLVNSLYNIVDSLFVARISEDAMTALSLVFPIQNFANAIAIGFGIGINAMIALYLGAGDHKKAETAATHGMVLSLMHGIL